MSSFAVRAQRLAKRYSVYRSPADRLLSLASAGRRSARTFAALEDVTFELPAGESLGLIGENGAGKSTLLKLIAGVTRPSAGELEVSGRVGSILELGSGFHPDFTGRQNIELNAAMLGLGRDEVVSRLPEIIDFSELGEFIDRPVRQYSSGMAMRLGFAVATQIDPDILIVDEALAVGDGYFQKKCMDRIVAFLRRGKTLLFCSHAMYYLSTLCQRALWLRDGRIAANGSTEDVVREYESHLLRKEARQNEAQRAEGGRPTTSPARIRKVAATNGGLRLEAGAAWGVEIQWRSESPETPFHVAVGVDLESGLTVLAFSTLHSGLEPFRGHHDYALRLRIPSLPLAKGAYSATVFLVDERGLHVYDRKGLPEAFSIAGGRFQHGFVLADHRWEPLDGG